MPSDVRGDAAPLRGAGDGGGGGATAMQGGDDDDDDDGGGGGVGGGGAVPMQARPISQVRSLWSRFRSSPGE